MSQSRVSVSSRSSVSNSNATREELEKLEEFRERVCKIYNAPDEKMLSWLRARNLDVGKAEQMLRRHLIWRKNNEIHTLTSWKSPKCFFPYLHSGYDREGAPVYIMPIGRWELRSSIECGDFVPSLLFVYQAMENIVSKGNDKGIFQGIVICDFEGFGYAQIAHRTVIQGMQEVVRVFDANYPEVLKHAFVINAPKIFNYVYALAKPLLNSRTLAKVQIYGDNRSKWAEELLKIIDSDQLPPYWGGSKEGSDEFCSDDWFMEPLPPNFLKKSSLCYDEFGDEWITMKVPAGEKIVFQYTLKGHGGGQGQGDGLLKWSFYTEGYDIGFMIYYGEKEESLVEYHRAESHVQKEEGMLTVSKPGKYTLTFDNGYSRTRAKTLHYSISFKDHLRASQNQDQANGTCNSGGNQDQDDDVFHDVISATPFANGKRKSLMNGDKNENELCSVRL